MKKLFIDDIEVGANFWGAANNVKLFVIYFSSKEVQGEETAEHGGKLAKELWEDFLALIEKKNLDKEYKEALIPGSPYVKSRFTLVGNCLAENRFTQAVTMEFLTNISKESAQIQTAQIYHHERTDRNAPRFDWIGSIKYRGENFKNKFNEVQGWYENFNIIMPLTDLANIKDESDVKEFTCMQMINHLFCCPGFILNTPEDLETFKKFYEPIFGCNHIDWTRIHLIPTDDYPKEAVDDLIKYAFEKRFKLQPLLKTGKFKKLYLDKLHKTSLSYFN